MLISILSRFLSKTILDCVWTAIYQELDFEKQFACLDAANYSGTVLSFSCSHLTSSKLSKHCERKINTGEVCNRHQSLICWI
jgi:hypothetical protein